MMPNATSLFHIPSLFSRIGLEEGMKVGDFGTGNSGIFAFAAAKIVGESGKVFAVDVMREACEAVRHHAETENIRNVSAIWSNLEIHGATPIADEALDRIFLINVLFQSEKKSDVLSEAARMLSLSGKMLIIDWQKRQDVFGPPQVLRIAKEDLTSMAEQAGLTLEQDFSAGKYHYGLIFSKHTI